MGASPMQFAALAASLVRPLARRSAWARRPCHEMRTLILFFVIAIATQVARAGDITVSAAVSLKEALTEVAKAYEKQTGARVNLNFGATGHLLAQVRDGAPVDGF